MPQPTSPLVASASQTPPTGTTTRRARVLVVDDFEDARELYCLALENAGFRALEADNGAAALERAAAAPPDAIVLDISMPGMDGWEVVRRLREDDRTRGIPVVVLTGSGFRGQVTAVESGCAAYLMKPCSPQQLLEVVRTIVDAQMAAAMGARRDIG